MPDDYQRKYAKKFAFANAGKIVYFVELEGSEKREGRIVGYYEELAQVVIECAHEPKYPIDPLQTYLKPVAMLEMNRNRKYVCVPPYLIDTVAYARDARFPHDCPRCHSPAFILFRSVECSSVACENHKQ
jgi:hypothetical protein